MHTSTSATPFKSCTKCDTIWEDVQSFIEDPNLKLNGYLPDFDQPGNGLIIVTHKIPDCGSSFSLRASLFRELYKGPDYKEHMTAQPGCEGKCFIYDDYSKCSNHCDMRWVRDVMLLINSNEFPAALKKKLEKVDS